jgi:type I restriction enzyme, S subunit
VAPFIPTEDELMHNGLQERTYLPIECVVFRKTKEDFGGLSNMAGGFPLRVNGTMIWSSEALYQACRFPLRPDIQEIILYERSPMTAKMKSKPFREYTRPDWERVKIKVMRWCLRVKLAQNWNQFGQLLLFTAQKPIVEESHKDIFWGAKRQKDGTLIGVNALGRFLMELRHELRSPASKDMRRVAVPEISEFKLLGEPINTVEADSPGKPIQSATQASPRQSVANGRDDLWG